LLGRMPQVREVVDDDRVIPYILMSLKHDGTGAIHFGPCFTRVVCANTHAMALTEKTIKELSIRHTGCVEEKLSQARAILKLTSEHYDDYIDLARELAAKPFHREEWYRFLEVMCPELNADDPDYTEQRAERIAETRLALTKCFVNEREMIASVANTAWAAVNAVTKHIDHLPRRGATQERKAEARFNVCLYGVGRNMKQRALEAACRIAGVNYALGG